MITVHLAGTLARAPEVRQTSKGSPYTTAVLLTGEDDSATITHVSAFESLGTILAGLVKGDGLTVIGTARLSAYSDKKTSEPRASLAVTASRLITTVEIQQSPRQKVSIKAPPPEWYMATAEAFTDEIPF